LLAISFRFLIAFWNRVFRVQQATRVVTYLKMAIYSPRIIIIGNTITVPW
jgi:hypothetical protein